MSDEREPDTGDDPRKKDTPEGRPESDPEAGTDDQPQAPSVDGDGQDSPPSKATGNPNAAGP